MPVGPGTGQACAAVGLQGHRRETSLSGCEPRPGAPGQETVHLMSQDDSLQKVTQAFLGKLRPPQSHRSQSTEWHPLHPLLPQKTLPLPRQCHSCRMLGRPGPASFNTAESSTWRNTNALKR